MRGDVFEGWVEAVATGAATMSQRNLKWVELNGGLEKLVETAKARGIHLARLTDDKGNELLAASRDPIETLC